MRRAGEDVVRLDDVLRALLAERAGLDLAEADRARYHAALAHGSNHLVTLVAQSAELLAEAGVANPSRMLGPLLGAALDNALRRGDAALTGPVARGDADTVRAHLAAPRSPEVRAAYVAMSRLTAVRALAAGVLTADGAEALLDVLSSDEAPR